MSTLTALSFPALTIEEGSTAPLSAQAATDQWEQAFEGLNERLLPRFARKEVRQHAKAYLQGLLRPLKRKNGWQLAEQAGDPTPYALQHLLGRACWNANQVRDDLSNYVIEYLGQEQAVLVIDETGFLKKGDQSVGVQRQYSGTAGRIENCQVGVFLAYASEQGQSLLDRELYLPKEWANAPHRRQAAGVPKRVAFATKPQLARQMLERAFAANVPHAWVTGDSIYGSDRRLRLWLESQAHAYVLGVTSQEPLWVGFTQQRAARLAGNLASESWQRLSAGAGSKGARLYDWALVPFNPPLQKGFNHWLLARRSVSHPQEIAYYVVFAPAQVTLETLVQVAGKRWAIEMAFECAKGEVGLDEYEVRSWPGWYRHITLAMFAQAFLSVLRAHGIDPLKQAGKKGASNLPASNSLRPFKRRRGLYCP